MTPEDVRRANAQLNGCSPEEIIAWAHRRYKTKLVMSTSFGPNAGVLLHMALTRYPDMEVIFINPGDVPKTNWDYAKALADRIGLSVLEFVPTPPATEDELAQVKRGGAARLRAYQRLKVEPMRRALRELEALAVLHGARADQNENRAKFSHLQLHDDGRVRFYPILKITSRDAAEYLVRHDLPVHPSGFPGGVRLDCGIHEKMQPATL